MSSQLRYARLTGSMEPGIPGGGIQLSAAFKAPLRYLLDNGRTAPADVLAKAVRDALILDYKRVMHVWGSWEAFLDDLMEQAQEKEVTVRNPDGSWSIHPDFHSGRVRLLPGLRLTLRSEQEEKARENLAWARLKMSDYKIALSARGLYEGRTASTLDAHLATLQWDSERAEDEKWEGMAKAPQRKKNSIRDFTLAWIAQNDGWFTASEVIGAFNRENPDDSRKPASPSTVLRHLHKYTERGMLEQRYGIVTGLPGRPRSWFRRTG